MADELAASRRFVALVGAIVALAALLATRSLDAPGLYYDEAVQARPAAEFVTGVAYGTPFPGSRTVEIAGRPFPWMTQPYMGGLKSQLLIPFVALFGAEAPVLRATTLCWALLGVVLIAAFARRAFGESTAVFATLLLAFDPSLLLLARHDWGSFAISLLLRGAALACLFRWWQSEQTRWLFAGSLALGLGIFNKVDFAIFLAAAGLGVLACAAGPLWRRARAKPRELLIAAAGAALGVLPMLPSAASVLAARTAFAREGESAEKLTTLWTMLDGSYFHRLMEQGGLFDRMQEATLSQGTLLCWAFLLALPAALLLTLRTHQRGAASKRRTAGIFLLVASCGAVAAYMALPGGVRIHHALNIYPFPHLLIAWVLARAASAGGALRSVALASAAIIAISGVATFHQALAFSAETGGRGRWSHALNDFAGELDASDAVVLSLDWGFHETLGFLTRGPTLIDAYPRIPAMVSQRGVWESAGSPEHVYLVHDEPYDLFGYGPLFLRAAARLPPAQVTLRRHLDGEGELAFVSVRFARPHRIVFGRTGFDIRLD